MKKCIFLDRDGTINVEKDYLHKIEDFEFEKDVISALQLLRDEGYIFIVVTNQSGIARGYYTEEDLINLNDYINKQLNNSNINIEKFYYCPHHLQKGIGEYKIECDCRKPSPGMILNGIKEFEVDIKNSFMVGDNFSDIEAGINAGVTPILVTTGHGFEHLERVKKMGIKTYSSLLNFALDIQNNK